MGHRPLPSAATLIFLFGLNLLFTSSAFAGGDHQQFELGDFALESGDILPQAKLSYVTHGELNADRSNLVLLPSYYLGDHHGYDFLIGEDLALDPEKYFIVATDMFQNGLSSSPSNTPAPFNGPDFPPIQIRDNVEAVYRLLTEEFAVDHIAAVIGFSMGAQQAFQWAVSYPQFMDQAVGYCGSAREYPHGQVRLAGFKAAIMADAAYNEGYYDSNPALGIRAGAVHWAAWGRSQEWFRQTYGNEFDLDAFLSTAAGSFLAWDANDMIALATTWQNNNVGDTPGFGGDHIAALNSIEAQILYMPCETDLYFHITALSEEARHIPNAQYTVIPSLLGHLAGVGINPEDVRFINKTIRNFLESPE